MKSVTYPLDEYNPLTSQTSNAIFSQHWRFFYLKGFAGGATLLLFAFLVQVAYQIARPRPQVGMTSSVIVGTLPVSVALAVALFAAGFAVAARSF
jgi:hypothetical protein